MPLAGHDRINDVNNGKSYVISTPMPLAGHDKESVEASEELAISTPMPLAGHDNISFRF